MGASSAKKRAGPATDSDSQLTLQGGRLFHWDGSVDHPPITAEIFRLDGDDLIHDHDFMEIALVIGGEADHLTAYGQRRLREGDVVILRPGAWHVYRQARQFAVYNCCFAVELLQRELGALRSDPALNYLLWTGPKARGRSRSGGGVMSLTLPPLGLGRCARALERLVRITGRDPVSGASPSEAAEANLADRLGLLLVLLGELARHLQPSERPARNDQPMTHPAVTETVRLLEQRFSYHWTLAELASAVRLDEAYLVRLFKAAVGIPPMAYLARIRVERATGLLLHTAAAVSEIGRRVGWEDPNYFARRFRSHTGLFPTAYRSRGGPTMKFGRPNRATLPSRSAR